MTIDDWNSPDERTLQYLAASTPEFEEFNRILLVVHAHESRRRGRARPSTRGSPGTPCSGTPPTRRRRDAATEHAPGEHITITGPSMQLFRAHGDAD